MSTIQTLPPLPEIKHHEKLPQGAREIARIKDGEALITFVNYKKWLILVRPDYFMEYSTTQIDLPMGFLNWFPQALDDFRKPPVEGGLRAGAMVSDVELVDGEELCIMRAMGDRAWPEKGPPPGYVVENRSRLEHDYEDLPELRDPQTTKFSEQFLFEGGLLSLIRQLGAQYSSGIL